MFKRQVFCVIFSLTLLLGFSDQIFSKKTDSKKTHLGGCILISPTGKVPGDLYQESDVVPTDEYKPFTKKLMVYGITLIGRDDISDAFMKKVAKTIRAMFSQGGSIDAELQKEVLKNLYRYRAVIPLFKGEDHEFTPADEKLLAVTFSQNSICDIIMEGVAGQVNEVVEHILHYVTDVGLHYTFPAEWGISKTSKVYQAMQEAVDKKYYNIEQYQEADGEEKTRVLIQEYAYWIIYITWDLREIFGPMQAEFSIIKSADLKAKLLKSYELVVQTIPKVMKAPSREMLKKLFQ